MSALVERFDKLLCDIEERLVMEHAELSRRRAELSVLDDMAGPALVAHALRRAAAEAAQEEQRADEVEESSKADETDEDVPPLNPPRAPGKGKR